MRLLIIAYFGFWWYFVLLGKRKNGPIKYSKSRNSEEMEPNAFESCSIKELIRGRSKKIDKFFKLFNPFSKLWINDFLQHICNQMINVNAENGSKIKIWIQ